jgi:hypothetical protein
MQTTTPAVDKVFYNMTINNPEVSTVDIPVIFDEILDRSILGGKTNDWEVSIVRFSIPLFNVPLFTFIDGQQKITMTYKTYTSGHIAVPFISNIADPSARQVYDLSYYQQMINAGIVLAYNALDASYFAGTGFHLPTTDKPYCIYDKTTQRFSFYATSTYYQNTSANLIGLKVNRAVFVKIQSIDIYYNGVIDEEWDIIFQNNLNNMTAVGGGVYLIQNLQQEDNFGNLIDFVGIEITTNLPAQLQYLKQGTGENILISYIPLSPNLNTFHNSLTYNAIVPYNQSQLLSDSVLSEIVMRVRYTNVAGDKILLYMPPNSHAELKLMFQRRAEAKY